jgi:CO dehydrogenase/acetyl-CoA synthase alpha subunit
VRLKVSKGLLLVGANDVRVVVLGMHVAHHLVRILADDGVADGVDQVGLAETGAAVDEQRVVGAARIVGDLDGRRPGQIVGLADDQIVEGERGNSRDFS